LVPKNLSTGPGNLGRLLASTLVAVKRAVPTLRDLFEGIKGRPPKCPEELNQ